MKEQTKETSLPAVELKAALPLEPIAMVALDAGRMSMEAGASAQNVDDIVARVARGLGAERVDLRIGYASLAITIGIGDNGITRMRKVGHLGVNQRVEQALQELAGRIEQGELTEAEARAGLERVAKTPRHSSVAMAVAVGFACAAFGRLLGADWLATGPIFVASALGQYVRRDLLTRHVNVFIAAAVVAFLSSLLGGLGARWAGSETVATAMIASILLLVPGVPSLNAQNDILEGRPTLGSARAVWVAVLLIFVTAGLWLGQVVLAEKVDMISKAAPSLDWARLVHHMVCGAIAAVGFGVLFNIGFRPLLWCAASGGLALAVRTFCHGSGWSLEAASFMAALAVGAGAQVLRSRTGISTTALDAAGCIPMVPGSFAAKAILGLFALTAPGMNGATDMLTIAIEYALRVTFIIGALGTGLAIPTLLLRVRITK